MNTTSARTSVSDRLLRAFLHPPAILPDGGWGIIVTMIVVIGVSDYLSGTDASLAIFYLVPVLLMTAWRGARPGVVVAVACTFTRIVSDSFATYPTAPDWSIFWNAFASLAIALLVSWLLDALLGLHRALESKIAERTAQLELSVAERGRLERELLEVSSRERSNFGRELHDEIGQHLVATALAVQALAQRISGPLASEALAIVDWTEQAIAKTRSLARGLLLAEISPEQLVTELEELSTVARQARLAFTVDYDGTPINASRLECAQFFRIAQEAVSNAVRHARATRVTISVAQQPGAFCVAVEDDGVGLPPVRNGSGMGLQIMTQRARLIGAEVRVEKRQPKGTRVVCTLPATNSKTHG